MSKKFRALRVLMPHNAYRERGGKDEAVDAEHALLQSAGHFVDRFVVDNRDLPQGWPVAAAPSAIWSGTSYATVRKRLEIGGYDIVHVHNFLPQ